MAKRGMGCGIAVGAVGLLAVIIIAAAANSGSSTSSAPSSSVAGANVPAGDADAAKDVRIDTCGVETNTFGTQSKVRVTITNHTGRAQSYFVTVAINDTSGSTRYGEATAVTNSLGAGQSTALDAVGFPGKPPGAFTCSVARVDRLPV